MPRRPLRVGIAGAGIAGLTAALCLERSGHTVELFDKAAALEPVGAGLQLSPNATRILAGLGVLPAIEALSVEPDGIALIEARRLRRLAVVPLGPSARQRWGAPYLTMHRGALQQALLEAVAARGIAVRLGQAVVRAEGAPDAFDLTVGADGVWSTLRCAAGLGVPSRFTGRVAWRTTLTARQAAEADFVSPRHVSAFLHPGFHLVAYPLAGSAGLNLVAVARGPDDAASGWSGAADPGVLHRAAKGAAPALRGLVDLADRWTTWPIHAVDAGTRWSDGDRLVLVGDAAHALSPYAAQGAAMAIEDAAVLARSLESHDALAEALAGFEAARRPRLARVRRRGAFNRLTWHAGGAVAMVRDRVIATRRPEALAADLDWLYGWRAEDAFAGSL